MSKLKQVRGNLNLTQHEFAAGAGIKRSAIAMLETRPDSKPTLDVAFKIADFLGYTQIQQLKELFR